jgi:hypothetical protein
LLPLHADYPIIEGDVVGIELPPQPAGVTRLIFGSGPFGVTVYGTGNGLVVTHVEPEGSGAEQRVEVREWMLHVELYIYIMRALCHMKAIGVILYLWYLSVFQSPLYLLAPLRSIPCLLQHVYHLLFLNLFPSSCHTLTYYYFYRSATTWWS